VVATRIFRAIVLGLAVFASGPIAAQESRTISHELGTTEITGRPIRVVALEFSFIQALVELGVTPVGITDDSQPARIEQLLGRNIEYSSVGTRLEPNLELISRLQPDLIVADLRRHAGIYETLSSIAPTIVLNSWDGSYQDIKDSIVTIADALGEKTAGEKLVADHEARMKALAAKIPVGDKRRFLLAVAATDSLALHTSSSFSGSVFLALGLTPALVADAPTEGGVGLERLVAVNPDVLLVATEPGTATVFEQWRDNTAWSNIAAVRNGLLYHVDRNQYARFRGLGTAELIARDIVTKVYGAQ
jgi:ABC-type Fe3+-citrate transport system substrate-binding protein